MALFKIVDQDRDQLIVETHYYAWLKSKQPKDIHRIYTKVSYLEEQGFKRGIDKISEIDSNSLNAIEDVYFRNEIVNK